MRTPAPTSSGGPLAIVFDKTQPPPGIERRQPQPREKRVLGREAYGSRFNNRDSVCASAAGNWYWPISSSVTQR